MKDTNVPKEYMYSLTQPSSRAWSRAASICCRDVTLPFAPRQSAELAISKRRQTHLIQRALHNVSIPRSSPTARAFTIGGAPKGNYFSNC